MNTEYERFLASKRLVAKASGFDCGTLPDYLKDIQRAVIPWGLRRGKSLVAIDCGLGKSLIEFQFGDQVHKKTGGNVLLLTPLGVRQQMKREADKFGIETPTKICMEQSEVEPGITIANYDRLHKFDADSFIGVIPDEASLLKSMDGATRNTLIERFARTPFKLACTATPAPNDHMELGNYAEFLGVMTRSEMLSMFFTHDGGDTSKWRLRGHAEKRFWEWMSTWAIMIRKPSDIGLSDDGYELPPLTIHEHFVESPISGGRLFQVSAETLSDQREARRETITHRVEVIRSRILANPGPRVIWCGLNDESKATVEALRDLGAVEITGSDPTELKESRLLDFSEGRIPYLVTKGDICGHGLNWQHAHLQSFNGLNHSWELYRQCIGRMQRFGQLHPVEVDVVCSDREIGVWQNVKRKEAEAERMFNGMIEAMSDFTRREIGSMIRDTTEYKPAQKMEIPSWMAS